MSCSPYYCVALPACPESIVVDGGLLPNTQHRWEIKDKFNTVYTGNTTTDAITGLLAIDVAGNDDFPKGLFMEFSGVFLLQIFPYNSTYQAAPETFTIGAMEYTTIELSFRKYVGDVNGSVYVPPAHNSAPIIVNGSNGDNTAIVPAGAFVDKILVDAPAGTSIYCGTAAGLHDVFEAITTGSLNWASIGVDIHDNDNATTLYFSGVKAETTITLFPR